MTLLANIWCCQSTVEAQLRQKRVEPSTELRAKVTDLIDEIYESEVELSVVLRHSKIMKMKHDIFRVAVADPSIIEFVAFGSREVEIIGKQTGTTTLTLWLGTPQQTRLLSMVVTVTRDDAAEDRRRLEYGELQKMVNAMFPNSKIQLIPIADKVIVRGDASDEQEAMRIMSIIRKQGSFGGNFGGNGGSASISQGTVADPFPEGTTLPTSTVVSMLRVSGEKQVLLKVRIAELKRSAARQLGADFNLDVGDFLFSSVMSGGGNILTSGTFDDDSFQLFLNAVETNGFGKILAEPNLVVLSGKTATFLAGGEFAVPTVVGVGGAQAATTSFKGFGTQLTFTPTILSNDRIRLQVNPTFSTLNSANSVGGVFGTDTRSVSTTVELREGQVLAIAGLLQEQQRGDSSRIPVIGNIPFLNVLTSNKSITRDETELIVLISPELVHPMEPGNAPTILPGMEVTEPDDFEFFIFGHIEGKPNCQHRSTVWPLYRSRIHKAKKNQEVLYSASEDYYIHGPHGFSE